MKLSILLVPILIVICNCSFAQETYQRDWATYYGGENTVLLDDASDSQGNIYIVGYVEGTASFNNQFSTNNALQPQYGGGASDGFIAKFNPNGLLLWSSFYGALGDDYISSIHIDKSDNIYIVGETSSSGLATIGSFQQNFAGSTDGFLTRLDSSGSVIWSTYIGTETDDQTQGVVCDDFGNIFLYGITKSMSGITTQGAFQENATLVAPAYINFISRFSADGGRVWSTYYGTSIGNTNSKITGIAVNDSGIYIAGTVVDYTANTYFSTPGAFQSINGGGSQLGADIFLSKFSFEGSRIWSTYFGGLALDLTISSGGHITNARSVAVTRDFVYLAGITNGPTNLSTSGAYQTSKTNYSNLIAQFDIFGNRIWSTYLGNSGTGFVPLLPHALTIDLDGNLFISGSTQINNISTAESFQSQITIPPGSTEIPPHEGYVAKMSSDGSTLKYATYYGGIGSERASRTLFHENGFYIIGTTSSAENISTTGSFQENLMLSGANQLPFPSNAFIAKFSEIPLDTKEFYKDNLVIYPVPNSGSFHINLNENYFGSTITIIDSSGKTVHTDKLKTAQQHINVPNLAKGIYVVKISYGKSLGYEKKILVE